MPHEPVCPVSAIAPFPMHDAAQLAHRCYESSPPGWPYFARHNDVTYPWRLTKNFDSVSKNLAIYLFLLLI
jgi:hypothetical protein